MYEPSGLYNDRDLGQDNTYTGNTAQPSKDLSIVLSLISCEYRNDLIHQMTTKIDFYKYGTHATRHDTFPPSPLGLLKVILIQKIETQSLRTSSSTTISIVY